MAETEYYQKRQLPKGRLIFYLVLIALSFTGVILFAVFPVRTGDGTADKLLASVLPQTCILIPLVFLMCWNYRSLLRFPFLKRRFLWALPCLLAVLANFPYSALITGNATIVRADFLWLFLIKCILIGVTEEWIFRGIFLDFLLALAKKKRRSCFLPVLISSAVFALVHLLNLFEGMGFLTVLMQVGYSFLIGGMLAVVFVKTENLWLCVILHAIFDVGGLIISDLGAGNPHDLVFWILTAVFGVFCAVHVIFTLVKTCRGTRLRFV